MQPRPSAGGSTLRHPPSPPVPLCGQPRPPAQPPAVALPVPVARPRRRDQAACGRWSQHSSVGLAEAPGLRGCWPRAVYLSPSCRALGCSQCLLSQVPRKGFSAQNWLRSLQLPSGAPSKRGAVRGYRGYRKSRGTQGHWTPPLNTHPCTGRRGLAAGCCRPPGVRASCKRGDRTWVLEGPWGGGHHSAPPYTPPPTSPCGGGHVWLPPRGQARPARRGGAASPRR